MSAGFLEKSISAARRGLPKVTVIFFGLGQKAARCPISVVLNSLVKFLFPLEDETRRSLVATSNLCTSLKKPKRVVYEYVRPFWVCFGNAPSK